MHAATRLIDGAPFFTILHRGERMEKSCLRCHSTPDRAPAELVAHYGPERSFNRHVGEVVSAVSIREPLSVAYARANSESAQMSMVALLLIGLIWAVISYFSNRFVFTPIIRFQEAARRISENPALLGEPVMEPFGEELSDMAKAFNAMSAKLAENRDELENQIMEKTAELTELNRTLKNEVAMIHSLEAERSEMIGDLQKALAKVDILSGLLPICLVCKKVRDEDGTWSQIEAYIKSRTDTEFSHGYCPECAEELLDKIKK